MKIFGQYGARASIKTNRYRFYSFGKNQFGTNPKIVFEMEIIYES